jgi:hypothetical protein
MLTTPERKILGVSVPKGRSLKVTKIVDLEQNMGTIRLEDDQLWR